MTISSTDSWLVRAAQCMPGGVSSPVRSFAHVGGKPLVITRGEGAYVYDSEGREYIDYVCSWGAILLGHCRAEVSSAIAQQNLAGVGFGATTDTEILMAESLCARMPEVENVRLVSSGSEAVMTAIRLARGSSGRHKIIKFAGCYHGHSDSMLVRAGSGVLTGGHPDSAGVTPGCANDTLVAPYNSLAGVQQLFDKYPQEIAAVIIEPIPGNMGMILPAADFLDGLRQLCQQYGSLLIFDEVMTGLRVDYVGALGHYGVAADIVTLGKVIGGGLPVGAVCASKALMANLAPMGPVYQAGTLSGNPLTMAAGLKVLELTANPLLYRQLDDYSKALVEELEILAGKQNIPFTTQAMGGMFGLFFRTTLPTNLDEVMTSDKELFRKFFLGMLAEGIFLPPSPYEAFFITTEHDDKVLDKTLTAAAKVFAKLAS